MAENSVASRKIQKQRQNFPGQICDRPVTMKKRQVFDRMISEGVGESAGQSLIGY
jgi:hypothetical protein